MSKRAPLALAVAVVGSCIVFVAAVRHQFVWDDYLHLVENPHLNPVSAGGLAALWAGPFEFLYAPVVYTVWAGLSLFARGDGGLSPVPFHLLNVLLHALNSLAVLLLLRRLIRDPWAAAAGAVLFALHPLQVEPVVWASGLKDVLCGSFCLGALLQLVGKGEAPPRRAAFVAATVLYALALLTKPAAVALPILAAAIEGPALGRPRRRVLTTFVLWTLLALPLFLITRQVQPLPPSVADVPLLLRPMVALDALAFYLGKLVLPLQLTIDYGRKPAVVLASGTTALTVGAALLVVVLCGWAARRERLVGVAGLLFAGALLPVLGLVPFLFQSVSTVADRYCYLALLGPALLLAVLLRERSRRVLVAVAAMLLLLGGRSALQVPVWADRASLFSHALAHNADSFAAHKGLAEVYDDAGDLPRAIAHARRAAELGPLFASWFHLGSLLGAQGQFDESERYLKLALEEFPEDGRVHYNLGLLQKKRGNTQQAIVHFRAAHQHAPQLRQAAAWQLRGLGAAQK